MLRGLVLLSTILWSASAQAEEPGRRLLSIGGSLTEIVYALGEQDRLVARDVTSTYPEAARALPDVGYMRALSPEGILSVSPDLIIAEEGAGPPETLAVLKEAVIPLTIIRDEFSAEGIAAKIRAVGTVLDAGDAAGALANKVLADMAAAEDKASLSATAPKKVLFVLAVQSGRIMASGTNSAADAMIRLSGGVNAIQSFEGYRTLTDEAIGAAAPDVILMMDRGGNMAVTDEELFALSAISLTPAARNKAVVRMNGLYLLGFGPRTAEAVMELNRALYDD